jgi:hypothetical protein
MTAMSYEDDTMDTTTTAVALEAKVTVMVVVAAVGAVTAMSDGGAKDGGNDTPRCLRQRRQQQSW